MGVDIRGRPQNLRVYYRTSHQIRQQADRLLPDSVSDVDGDVESRKGTVSVFNGPPPEIQIFEDSHVGTDAVASRLHDQLASGLVPDEIGIFVRSVSQLPRARAALKAAGTGWVELERTTRQATGKIALSTMHPAKGLEFRSVNILACDDVILPLQMRNETVTDERGLEEIYTTERHLTDVDPASEFSEDLES